MKRKARDMAGFGRPKLNLGEIVTYHGDRCRVIAIVGGVSDPYEYRFQPVDDVQRAPFYIGEAEVDVFVTRCAEGDGCPS